MSVLNINNMLFWRSLNFIFPQTPDRLTPDPDGHPADLASSFPLVLNYVRIVLETK